MTAGVVVRLERPGTEALASLLTADLPPHARLLVARDGATQQPIGVLALTPGPDDFAELLALEVVSGLGEERDDGGARVAADDGDVLVGGVRVADLGDEARGADDVEGGDAEEALGVVDALALEDLGGDGDRGVDLCSLA